LIQIDPCIIFCPADDSEAELWHIEDWVRGLYDKNFWIHDVWRSLTLKSIHRKESEVLSEKQKNAEPKACGT